MNTGHRCNIGEHLLLDRHLLENNFDHEGNVGKTIRASRTDYERLQSGGAVDKLTVP